MSLTKSQKTVIDACAHVAELSAAFMASFGFKYFVYTRVSNNQKVIGLSSNANIIEQSFMAGYTPPKETWCGLAKPQSIHIPNAYHTGGTWISEGLPMQQTLFSIDHPFTLIKTEKASVETFTFMSHITDYAAINRCLSHTEVLWQFTHYFKYMAKPLIKKINQHPLLFNNAPTRQTPISFQVKNKHNTLSLSHLLPSKSYFTIDGTEVILSKRQMQCLQGILLGKTTQQIADILGLKYTTAVAYIEEIKSKMQCQTRYELISIFVAHGYIHDLMTLLNLEIMQ